jgi:hypothetical protein
MYLEFGELIALDMFMSDAATYRARSVENCEFCGVAAAPAEGDESTRLNWLRAHRPELATKVLDEPCGHVWYDARDEAARAVWDSQLEPTIGIPEELLVGLVPDLPPELREFVEDRFVFAICGRCLSDPESLQWFSAEAAIKRYVDVHFEGNQEAAARQSSWPQAEELASRLSGALLRSKRAG